MMCKDCEDVWDMQVYKKKGDFGSICRALICDNKNHCYTLTSGNVANEWLDTNVLVRLKGRWW